MYKSGSRISEFLVSICVAIALVYVVSCWGNHIATPYKWGMASYLDMASNGIWHNEHLRAPFAYRFGGPLLIGTVADWLNIPLVQAFHYATWLGSVAFLLLCYGYARFLGCSPPAGLVIMLASGLFYGHIKNSLYFYMPVDLYGWCFLIIAFYLLLKDHFYACLIVSGIGLFFREFMLIPLLVQAALLCTSKRELASIALPLSMIAVTLALCFLLPRFLIPVSSSTQIIDPLNHSNSLNQLISYPLSLSRDLNLLFSYMAYLLPSLLLLTRKRLGQLWVALRGQKYLLFFLLVHVLLSLYGGNSMIRYVGYLVVVHCVVLAVLLKEGKIAWWEIAAMLILVSLFNRIWWHIPQPSPLAVFVRYYGGHGEVFTPRSIARFAELLGYMVAMGTLRQFAAWGLRHFPQTIWLRASLKP